MKVCPYCAEELADDVVLCTLCGKDTTAQDHRRTVAPEPPPPSAEQIVRASLTRTVEATGSSGSEMNRFAIAAFLLVMAIAILGTAARFPPGAAVVGFTAALALAIVAIGRDRSRPGGLGGTGFATAAAVLAVIGLIGYGRQLFS